MVVDEDSVQNLDLKPRLIRQHMRSLDAPAQKVSDAGPFVLVGCKTVRSQKCVLVNRSECA